MNALLVAFVPADLGSDYFHGRISADELMRHPLTGTGTCLYIGHLETPAAWRALAEIITLTKPETIVFHSRTRSVLRRCQRFNPLQCGSRFMGQGEPLARFLDHMGRRAQNASARSFVTTAR